MLSLKKNDLRCTKREEKKISVPCNDRIGFKPISLEGRQSNTIRCWHAVGAFIVSMRCRLFPLVVVVVVFRFRLAME